jgi:hypothetical protein
MGGLSEGVVTEIKIQAERERGREGPGVSEGRREEGKYITGDRVWSRDEENSGTGGRCICIFIERERMSGEDRWIGRVGKTDDREPVLSPARAS